MYEQFYGFKRKPFQLLPNADFFFRSKKHDIALTYLEFGIYEKAGFVVITGEIGTGKTTLLNYLLRTLPKELPIVYLSQTFLSPEEFLRMICQEFSLPHEGKKKSELIELFGRFLVEQYQKGGYAILILDEAQNFPFETLEEIRMLSNLDAGSENLLQIILVGQPSLREKLRWEGLRQLSQRVEVSYHLGPLDQEEVKEYIRYRLEKAEGTDLDLFSDEAIEEIWKYSTGVPRIINAVCHMCLVYGMADELKKVDRSLVLNVLKDRSNWDILPVEKGEAEKDVSRAPSAQTDLTKLEGIFRSIDSKLGLMAEMAASFKMNPQREAPTLEGGAGFPGGFNFKEAEKSLKKEWNLFLRRLSRIEETLNRGVAEQKHLISLLSLQRNNSSLKKEEKDEKKFSYKTSLALGAGVAILLGLLLLHLFVIDLHTLWVRVIGRIPFLPLLMK